MVNINNIFKVFCHSEYQEFETLWASPSASTQQKGISNFTASTVSDAVPHERP
jgi:hypothetical protein